MSADTIVPEKALSSDPIGPTSAEREAGLALMRAHLPVSRETVAALDAYAALLIKWSRAKNLIGPDTLSRLWTRHIADSAQVVAVSGIGAGKGEMLGRTCVDFGSGAGFPGLVMGIFAKGEAENPVHLVESNGRKCAFLREAARVSGAPVIVHNKRIEAFTGAFAGKVEIVTARALAPLEKLFALADPLLADGARAIFHKGQDVERELTEAARCWKFDYELVPSWTRPESALVVVNACRRRDD